MNINKVTNSNDHVIQSGDDDSDCVCAEKVAELTGCTLASRWCLHAGAQSARSVLLVM